MLLCVTHNCLRRAVRYCTQRIQEYSHTILSGTSGGDLGLKESNAIQLPFGMNDRTLKDRMKVQSEFVDFLPICNLKTQK